MGLFVVPDSVRLNLELQSKKMYNTLWREQLYLRWVGFANREPSEEGMEYIQPVGQMLNMDMARSVTEPFAVWEDFTTGGTGLQIPVKLIDHSRFVFGDDTLQGKGYRPKWGYKFLRIGEIAKARSTKSGHYTEQTYMKYLPKLVKQARPELTDQIGRYINTAMIKYALHYGKSYELLLGTTSYGRGLSAISHPNMYVPGSASGWVSYNATTDTYTNLPGSAGYETDVETAVNTLTDTGTKHFTCALVDKMRFLVPRRRIKPCININGRPFYLWIITSLQAKQLTADQTWKDNAQTILPRETDPLKNWLLNGALGAYNGFIFVEDIEGWGAHTNTNPQGWATAPSSGALGWGPEILSTGDDFTLIKNLDGSPYQTSFILGSRALDIGIAKRPFFTEETWDHDRKKEIGVTMLTGAERSTLFDTDNQTGAGAGAFIEDTGSAMVVTYSPAIT